MFKCFILYRRIMCQEQEDETNRENETGPVVGREEKEMFKQEFVLHGNLDSFRINSCAGGRLENFFLGLLEHIPFVSFYFKFKTELGFRLRWSECLYDAPSVSPSL
ncbi:hypothetical protein CDAR_456141 [Caerostris darwini]|uniref:Uncharacterized protein n=1 Tax=Caerostris darwini TaxID=1538125 RepID=A0AAV4RSP4_9ARAC|nr:hypothetical protein CDAR_456141 [Caerostris darwini]